MERMECGPLSIVSEYEEERRQEGLWHESTSGEWLSGELLSDGCAVRSDDCVNCACAR